MKARAVRILLTPRAVKTLLAVVAALALGGCLSKSQFSGRYLDDVQTYTKNEPEFRMEIRSGVEIAYNFWGRRPIGSRYDYTAYSTVSYPLCVKLTLSSAQPHHWLETRHDIEYRIEPYRSAWIATGLLAPNIRGETTSYQTLVRGC
ncbi:MAG: hypothetical protein Q8J78_09865 [Moraxellaceae bacterium]|nr:hypothetical protein [Moraxellaceae bacterium]